MKNLRIIILCVVATMFASCQKDNDYTAFVGMWGVERIEYKSYNIDYAGNPIQGSMEEKSYEYDPYDLNDGIHLIFRADKTGELRDGDVDTVWYDWNNETMAYDSYVVNPDTTLVTTFTYSYDKEDAILYMNMHYPHTYTYRMHVSNLTNSSFEYVNHYGTDDDGREYYETAYMKRVDGASAKSASRSAKRRRPTMPGSMLSRK